jgi:hypothetical protein
MAMGLAKRKALQSALRLLAQDRVEPTPENGASADVVVQPLLLAYAQEHSKAVKTQAAASSNASAAEPQPLQDA